MIAVAQAALAVRWVRAFVVVVDVIVAALARARDMVALMVAGGVESGGVGWDVYGSKCESRLVTRLQLAKT